jgi:hypothetical protein
MTFPGYYLSALVDPRELAPGWQRTKVSHHEYLWVIGAILIVTTLVMLWAALVRKKKRRRKYKYPHVEEKVEQKGGNPDASAHPNKTESRPRRRRRSRRSERRNPTLAETGGLPPVRDEWPEQEG